MIYELYYWPGIQGRGEFIRLALEAAGAQYRDVGLEPEETGGGVPAILKILEDQDLERPPFAPPFLRTSRRLIAQTPNILLFLGGPLKLAPRDAAGKLWTLGRAGEESTAVGRGGAGTGPYSDLT